MNKLHPMYGLFGYDYAKGKWVVFVVYSSDFFVRSISSIQKLLTARGRYLWPTWFVAELKSFSYEDGKYSVEVVDGVEFPEVLSLEQSIEQSKVVLRRVSDGY